MFQIDQAATILSYCSETNLSVAELIRRVRANSDKTIALIKELEARSLLLSETSKKHNVGRPRRIMRTSPIGEMFVREYKHLQELSLRSNENDIRQALHQAKLAQELVERGFSSYERFQEVNTLARNIASTAEIKRNAQ
jgi:predicted transcriptional regulator